MEGVIRKAYEKDGAFYDKIMYGFVRGLDDGTSEDTVPVARTLELTK
jgi:hypothetical protein